MLDSDYLLPITKKLVNGLNAKPGCKMVNKDIVASLLAQALHGMVKRGEITLTIPDNRSPQ